MGEELEDYHNLVFEGGAVKGFAYIGVIKELEDMGLLPKFKRFAGSSVGSLFASMLAIGFTAGEIISLKDSLDLNKLVSGFSFSKAYSIWDSFGMNKLNILEKQFRAIIKKKVDPDISLGNLYRQTKKDLVIVTCCLNREKAVYLHHSTYPKVTLINALLASITVPFLFKPRKFKFLGEMDYYVDGGTVDNYPIWIYNDLELLYSGKIDDIPRNIISSRTLGLKLLSKGEKNNADVFTGRRKIENISTYAVTLVNTLMVQIQRGDISKSYINQTVAIDTGDIYFLDFNITHKKIDMLVENGIDGIKRYFGNLDS